MPVYRLGEDPALFPPVSKADRSGLLAVGGDLSPERLLNAYARGIFPWYSEGQPILWHAPSPRFVLEPARAHVGRSLRKQVRRGVFQVKLDTAFPEVIRACSESPRPGQSGTWITDDMQEAYVRLHHLGFVHSAEAWQDGKLVGGLYGVSLGSIFFGESMFWRAPDASKVAFAVLLQQLVAWGFTLMDCQQETSHLARFGAEARPRKDFLRALEEGLKVPSRVGRWVLEVDPSAS